MTAKLKTAIRTKVGTRAARVLRLQGRIPASLQGEGKPHVDLSIDEHEFLGARRHHEHVFQLEFEGGGSDSVMVKELQWHPLGDVISHVEFRRVDLTRETEAEVMLVFIGHPKGGVLNHLVAQVTVGAIPALIPDSIEVNVDAMELGKPLYARDLKLPQGVRLVTAPGVSVAVVVIVKEEVAAPVAAAAPAEGAAPVAGAEKAAAGAAGDKAAGDKAAAAPAAAKAAPPKGGAKKE